MEIISLDGGVDLSRGPSDTPAGRLRDCFNYEVGWSRGYTRVDGFERFDGRVSPSSTTLWTATVLLSDYTGDYFEAGDRLIWTLGNRSGDAGVVSQILINLGMGVDSNLEISMAFDSANDLPPVGATISRRDTTNGDGSFVLTAEQVEPFADQWLADNTYRTNLAGGAETLRSQIGPVPGSGGTVVGLHFHEDALYAVRDVVRVTLSSDDYPKLEVGMYVYPGSPGSSSGGVGQVVEKYDDTLAVEIAPQTSAGFDVEAGDSIIIAYQAHFTGGEGEDGVSFNPLTDTPSAFNIPGASGATVLYVNVNIGSFNAGQAEGDIVAAIADSTSATGTPYTATDTVAGGTIDIDTIYYNAANTTDGRVTVVTVEDSADTAILWKSTLAGWEAADTTRTLRFVSGEQDPFSTTPVETTQTLTLGRAGLNDQATVPGWSSTTGGAAPTPVEDLTADMAANDAASGSCSVVGQLYAGGPIGGLTQNILLGRFRLDSNPLPDSAEILGLSFDFECEAANPNVTLTMGRNSNQSPTYTFDVPTTMGPVTIGEDGAGDAIELWNKDWTAKDFNDGLWQFRLSGQYNATGTSSVTIDHIFATVRYTELPGSTLYLWDGSADIGTIKTLSAVVESGAWADGDAAGFLTLEAWDILAVPAGTELRTAAGGLGLLIGVTNSGVVPVALPGSNLLNAEGSKYQFISHNFYATEDRNAIYGCSGAGKAFLYEPRTSRLGFITTGVGDEDKPRHVAHHLSRLALGYSWGEVYVSAPGEPDNFDGTDFAATFAFGDRITGMVPTVGDATAIFTESNTQMLVGANGDDSNPPRQQMVNARVGAIEYTCQSSGNRPIFASFRGIETLETTEQFGEFYSTRLTYPISPWLLPRLRTAGGLSAANKSVVNSVVVRNKNQYRLFFADGYVMTLTLVGEQAEPQNTIQFYYFNSDLSQPVKVFATCSGVTSDGRDRMFFSAEPVDTPADAEPPDVYMATEAVVATGDETDYVYEMDRGRSFDGGVIRAFYTLFYTFGGQQQNTMATATYPTLHLHGRGQGYSLCKLSRAINYEEISNPPRGYEDLPMGQDFGPVGVSVDMQYTKGRLNARGFAVSIRIDSETNDEYPHQHQQMTLLGDDPKRMNR